MRWLDRVRIQTLAIVAILSIFVAATVVSPYLPRTILHAQQVGPGGVPGAGGGGGAVSSVFGRTGAVTAQSGDYTAAQVTNAAATNAANTYSAVNAFPGGDLFFGGVNAQTGTSYAFVTTDENKLVTFSDSSAVAVTLSQATATGFTSGAHFGVLNLGAGTVSITPSISTINGAATLTLATGQSALIFSNGTNYFAVGSFAALTNQANTFTASQTISSGDSIAFNGYSNWTISSYTSSAGELLFSSPSHASNLAGVLDNNSGVYLNGFVLNDGGDACYSWTNGSTAEGPLDTYLCRSAAGVVQIGSGTYTGSNSSGMLKAAMVQAGGTVFTVAGCGTPTATGGASAGTFPAGSSTCNPVITFGKTTSNGFAAVIRDLTTTTATFVPTATTTTTESFTGTGVSSGDTIQVGPTEAY